MSASHSLSMQRSCLALARADGSPIRVLVVDEQRRLAETTSVALRREGAEVVTVHDGESALRASGNTDPDLAVVSPQLSDMEAIQCLRLLRKQQPGLLFLLLTGAEHGPDRMTRAAAGEYWLAKPFSLEELVLKARVTLRRGGIRLHTDEVELAVGDLVLNEDSRGVERAGEAITLSHREFELLRYLVRNEHRVLTKQQILGRVWPYNYAGSHKVVELYVSYLRKKIDVGREPLIHTLRGTGYIVKAAG